jgi:hypothetical protein
MRCLAITLLVLAFAGPEPIREPEQPPVSEWSKDSVLLLDRSYSMGTPGRWQAAVDAAMEQIDRMAAGERMAIIAFDDEAALVAPLQADQSLLRTHLTGLEAGSRGTQLGPAFDLAMGMLRRSPAAGQQILLVSDLQHSALQKTDGLTLDQGIGLEVLEVDTAVERNAAIISTSLLQTGAAGQALGIRLRNTGTDPLEAVEVILEIEGKVVERRRIALMPREEQTLLVPVVLAPDRAMAGRVLLGPDQIAADNRHHLVMMPELPLALTLLLNDDDPHAALSARFVEEAVRLSKNPPVRITRPEIAATLPDRIGQADVVITDTGSLVDSNLTEILNHYVEDGGSLLLVMGAPPADPTQGAAGRGTDDPGFPRGIGGLRRFQGSGAGIFLPADPGVHALWRDAGTDIAAALANTRVRMARDFDIRQAGYPSQVLARLTHGQPWLIEQTPGRGRLLLMTTGLGSLWGNLALEPGFVPLLHEVVRYLGHRTPTALAYTPGEVIDLGGQAANLPGGADWEKYLATGGSLVIELPEGGRHQLGAGERLYQPGQQGLFQVHRADGRPPSLMFAVNPNADESLLAPAGRAALQNRILRRPAPKSVTAFGDADDHDASPPPGWYLLGFATILLWLEAQLANRLSSRRLRAPENGITDRPAVADGGT